MVILRRITRTCLVLSGTVIAGYGLLSGLSLVREALGFLAHDGNVGVLAGGERTLLRTLLVGLGLTFVLGGAFLTPVVDHALLLRARAHGECD